MLNFSPYHLFNLIINCEHKKFIIYGTGPYEKRLYQIFYKCGIRVAFFITDTDPKESYCNLEVKTVYDILYEDFDELLILISDENDLKKFNMLESLGLKKYIHFRAMQHTPNYTYQEWAYDPNLGHNIINSNDAVPGFKIWGDVYNKDAIVIATLGGSTTCPFSYIYKSWSEFLYELLTEQGYQAVIYCGGMASYNVQQELVKAIRDIVPMHPHIVLGLDGINNLSFSSEEYPFLSSYQLRCCQYFEENNLNSAEVSYGVSSKEVLTPYKYFKRHVRFIHNILKTEGILYHCFLQPLTIACGEKFTAGELEKIVYFGEEYQITSNAFYHEYLEDEASLAYMHDITQIFKGYDNVYFDSQHVIEAGNKLIAKKIMDFLIEKNFV